MKNKACKHGIARVFCEICDLKDQIRQLKEELFMWEEECNNLVTILTTRPLPDGVTPEDMMLRNQILENTIRILQKEIKEMKNASLSRNV